MDIQQILKVLKNERECITRQSRPLGEMPQCRKDDDGVKLCEYCDLCLLDDEILEVYDFLINGYELLQNEGAESYTIKFKEPLSAVMTDEWGREHFNGICPYTGKKCGHWTCGICEVAERERRFAEGDTE
jgi:hypothetical protein